VEDDDDEEEDGEMVRAKQIETETEKMNER
jgi:hypothetical protein